MNGPTDSFEDFFHQSYKDSEVLNQSGDWNLPSDAVWEGIQEGMTEERKLSFVFLKWPWSAIAASYLLIMGGYQFMEKYTPQRDFASTMVIEQVAINDNLKTDNKISTNELPLQENMEQVTALIESSDQELENMEEARFFSTGLNMLDFPKTEQPYSNIEDLRQTASNQIVIEDKVTFMPLNIEIIEGLTKHSFQPLASLTREQTTINIPPITKRIKKQGNLYISSNYSTFSEDLIQRTLESSDQIVANTKTTKGNKVGVDVGWANKKGWAIETGIHFAKQAKETQVNQVIPASQMETNRNADGSNNIDMVWNNTNGKNEAGLIVKNSSASGTALSLKLTQNTKHRFIEIPLLVRKNWRMGKLSLSVKTGLLNRFNMANSFEEPTITMENGEFEVLASEFRRNTTIETKKYTPQLIAGIGVEYFIQPNLSVYIEPSFSKSIRPMIDFGFANIQSQNKAVTMGMRYHL